MDLVTLLAPTIAAAVLAWFFVGWNEARKRRDERRAVAYGSLLSALAYAAHVKEKTGEVSVDARAAWFQAQMQVTLYGSRAVLSFLARFHKNTASTGDIVALAQLMRSELSHWGFQGETVHDDVIAQSLFLERASKPAASRPRVKVEHDPDEDEHSADDGAEAGKPKRLKRER
jgi:hypothetical protein